MFKIDDVKSLEVAARKVLSADYSGIGSFPPSGCGRVYVGFSGGGLSKASKAVKILSGLGFKMTPRPYYSGVLIYVGYDNCSGTVLAKGEKIAQLFSENGFKAYMDADGD